MQPTLCSRCHKNVAVIFIQKMEGGTTKSEGLCLKCAKELGIKPVEDMMQKMGISDEDLEGLTNEMMSAFGGAEGMEGLVPAEDGDGRGGRGQDRHLPLPQQALRLGPEPPGPAPGAGAAPPGGTARRRRGTSPPSGSFWRTTASP